MKEVDFEIKASTKPKVRPREVVPASELIKDKLVKKPQKSTISSGLNDKYTLDKEYKRDLEKGLPINEPKNYYIDGDINVIWRSTANILFYNWLNYYVYQVTPYEIKTIKKY